MKTAELKVLPVAVLKPAQYNPRKKLKPGDKEYEKIKNSIEEFGFADPLVVNADMTIIGGHQRLTVAIDLGYTEVPCAVVDVDKTREKALNIALNKITGAWDENLLADLLKDIQRNIFETVISIDTPEQEVRIPSDSENLDGLNFLAGKRVDEVNKMAELGTRLAHVDGGVPNVHISFERLDEYNIGQFVYFFERACGISGYILGVNPFNQPGVEAYKKNMFALLDKPGYEEESKAIKARLK